MSGGFLDFSTLPGSMSPEDVFAALRRAPRGFGDGFGLGLAGSPYGTSDAPPAVAPAPRGLGPLSFGPLPSAGQPQAAARPPAAGLVPLPPQRPDDDALMAPAVADMPVPNAQPIAGHSSASNAARGASPGLPSPAFPAQPAAIGAPALSPAAPGGSPSPEPSIFDRIGSGLARFNANGGGDLLTSLGIGLMSTRGFGPGIATGLQLAQAQEGKRAATQLAQAEYGLKVGKLRQEQQSRNATASFVKTRIPGISDEHADALAGNSAFVNELFKNQLPPSEIYKQFTDGKGNIWSQNSRTGQATVALKAEKPDEPQLVDVPQPDGSTRKVWLNKGEADGTAVGAAKVAAPVVREFTGPDGTKRPFTFDPRTGGWRELEASGAAPSAGGNPYATGKFNNDQGKAAGFSDRMLGSEQILRGLEGINSGLGGNLAGELSKLTPNIWKSDDRQKFEQARRDFVNAQLRRESGAAISPSEFENAEAQYFPVPGDGPAVIAQKRVNRQRAIEAMGREGGPSYQPHSVFDENGQIVPYQPRARGQVQGQQAPAGDASARYRALIGSGMSKSDAFARMKSEGF